MPYNQAECSVSITLASGPTVIVMKVKVFSFSSNVTESSSALDIQYFLNCCDFKQAVEMGSEQVHLLHNTVWHALA